LLNVIIVYPFTRRGQSISKYAKAGVDISLAKKATEGIKQLVASTLRRGVLSGPGYFGSLFELSGYNQPVIVASTDGVGTKLKIAQTVCKYNTIGIDLVNHCVNDILTTGALPLFFLDYYATGKLKPTDLLEIVKGLSFACKEVDCALIGGETAEMPGLYRGDDFDLVGFIVGAVEKKQILPRIVTEGDIILGLPSNGLHTNGYSLARRILGQTPKALNTYVTEINGTIGNELMKPHRCYLKEIKPVLSKIVALAHITGGGLIDNLPRSLPDHLGARIDSNTWEIPPIFQLIQKRGQISINEMHQVFNMGIGMVVIIKPENLNQASKHLKDAIVIGKIIEKHDKARITID
jgi:phosphoribosylformylglycinamidine cyclo-ligase